MLGKVNAVVAAVLLSSGAYALAQTPGVQPGMQVVDTAGKPVGVVTSMKGANVVLKTDKHEVQLPASSFTPSNGKLLFGMTQAQVDAAAEQAVAEGQAAIKPGAEIYGMGGTLAGTIDSTEFETTSILKFIAERFQLDPLPNSRFHAVKSLASAFDFAAR